MSVRNMTPPQRAYSAREQCFLCDLPKMPWTILKEFKEPICRGCVNYEGSDRIAALIHHAKQHRVDASDTSKACRTPKSLNTPKTPVTPLERMAVSTTHPHPSQDGVFFKDPMPSPAALLGRDLMPSPSIVASSSTFLTDFPKVYGTSAVVAGSVLTSQPSLPNGPPPLMSPAASLAYQQGMYIL